MEWNVVLANYVTYLTQVTSLAIDQANKGKLSDYEKQRVKEGYE